MRPTKYKVLIACECSGRVRDAFIKRGISAISCDLQETEVPGPHYCGNVFDILYSGFKLMVAHPPCTHICVSGARHFCGGEAYIFTGDGDKPRWVSCNDCEADGPHCQSVSDVIKVWNHRASFVEGLPQADNKTPKICPTCQGSGKFVSGGAHTYGKTSSAISVPCFKCTGTGKLQA